MKRFKLIKIIGSLLIVASALALNPISASAVWINNPSGWWYTEGDSFATGWRLIDSKWYYFNSNGYMVTNTTVDGYYLNIDGVWSELTTSGDFKFDKSTGTIIDYIGSDNSVVIPSKLEGIDVKHISFISSPTLKSLTSITLPDSITNIETMQFKGYSNLKNIIIPNGLTTIGYQAFGYCSFTNITIPDSVTDIRSEAFLDCSNLTSITLPNNLTTIEDGVFYDCSGLTSITIPNSVTSIGRDAFCNCTKAKFYVTSEAVKQLLINYGIDQNRIILNAKS